MTTKVSSFNNIGSSCIFTLENGTIRMIGEPGKSGAFGFYSKGRHTVSTISDEGVNIRSIEDKSFVPPPTRMGKIVQCVTDGHTTFAINESGDLFAWGYFRKKDAKQLPLELKFKRIIRAAWDQIMFVTIDNQNILFTRRESDFYAHIRAELSEIGPVVRCSPGASIRYYLDEEGKLMTCTSYKQVDSEENEIEEINKKVVNDCVWAICDEKIYYKTVDGVVHCIEAKSNNNLPSYRHSKDSMLERMWRERDPVMWNAIDARDNFSTGTVAFLHSDNTVHVRNDSPVPFYHRKDSIAFDTNIVDFDTSMVLLDSGIVMPITNNAWTRTDMVLAAFPEWSDDESVVYEMCKLNPRNFLCASERLRNDLEFCKKIALLGQDGLKCVQGKMRRNRELRPIKRLYDMAKEANG